MCFRCENFARRNYRSRYALSPFDANSYWIGLNSLSGTESWEDGKTAVTFTKWGSGQPDHGQMNEARKIIIPNCVYICIYESVWDNSESLREVHSQHWRDLV